MNLVCMCVCLFAFSEATKSPRLMNFGTRPNLGQLKSLRSPIFEILIFKGGRKDGSHIVQCFCVFLFEKLSHFKDI